MQDDAQGYALKDGEGIRIDFRGTKILVKVSGEKSERLYTLLEMTHPPNVGPALHVHPKAPEAYYVLEGEYSVRYGDEAVLAKAGDFVFIPKGTPHNYQSGQKGGKSWSHRRRAWKGILQTWLTCLRNRR
jgi:mannose-6-phosphate isomerase-like protein (cupin superfamily)